MKTTFFATLAIIAFVLFGENLFSQGVAINSDGTTANPSAMLDVKSTNSGILVPRLTQVQRNAISNPATGLLIFQTDNTPGFYYNAGTSAVPSWIKLSIPTDNFDDADADATNELQTIGISGHDITLSNGGGTITVPDNNTTYSAGNQLSLSGTTFNVSEGTGSGLDADLLDGQHYSDIQTWVNANDDNTTYSAGTGLTLTGTVFTPTFGTTAGTVSEGNHAHATLTRGTGLTGNNYNGSTATTWAVDFGNATVAGNGTKAQGNFGQFQPHSTYTDFNANPAYWGWNYVQGNTNAPNTTSSQWYRQVISLGSDYPARGTGGYSLEMAFPRFNTAAAGVWMRTIESGAFGGWTRIDGGANVSGTTNYVAKFTSANVVGNSQIFDNGTNVGVGTASPSSKLHVDGGNINLAQTAGQTPFTLLGYNNASSLWLISPTTSSKIVIGVAHDWDRQIAVAYTPGTTGVAAGDLVIGQLDKNSAGWTHGLTRFYTNGGERMRIDASGNVGIGTASPSYKLHVPSGYIGTDYINTTDNVVGSGVTGIMVKTGDNYHRTASAAAICTFLNNGTFIPNNGIGDWQIASSSTATSYSTATLELRESNFTGTGAATPPRLGFHWGGIVASQIGIESSGRIAILNNPGTSYENFIANNIYSSANLYFTQANPTISASSYFIAPGGAYFNGGTVYCEAAIQARGGVNDDGGDLVLTGSSGIVNSASSYFLVASKYVVDGTDSWLRLNQQGSFASGIYSPGFFRVDGGIASGGIGSPGVGNIGFSGTHISASTPAFVCDAASQTGSSFYWRGTNGYANATFTGYMQLNYSGVPGAMNGDLYAYSYQVWDDFYYYDIINDLDAIDNMRPLLKQDIKTKEYSLVTDPESMPAFLCTKSEDGAGYYYDLQKTSAFAIGAVRQLRQETKTAEQALIAKVERLEIMIEDLTGYKIDELPFEQIATAYKGVTTFAIIDARIKQESIIKITGLINYEISEQKNGSFMLKLVNIPNEDIEFFYSSTY